MESGFFASSVFAVFIFKLFFFIADITSETENLVLAIEVHTQDVEERFVTDNTGFKTPDEDDLYNVSPADIPSVELNLT